MIELQAMARQIAALESQMAELRNALREIRSRVDKALAAEKEPNVYEQIRERHGKPFSELQAPAGYFFLMAGLEEQPPVFRIAGQEERWLGCTGYARAGPSIDPVLILRRAKKIVFVEDPGGTYVESGVALVLGHGSIHKTETRYRREGTP